MTQGRRIPTSQRRISVSRGLQGGVRKSKHEDNKSKQVDVVDSSGDVSDTSGQDPEPRGTPGERTARWETPLDDQVNPETLLISAVIQTGDYTTPAESGITADFFHSMRPEWEWLEKFVAKYRKVPDKATFRAQFPDFALLKTTDVAHGCEAVSKGHLRHSLTKSIKSATRLLLADQPEEALTDIHAQITGLNNTNGRRVSNVLVDYNEVFKEAARRAEAATSGGLAGIDTGFPTLNDRTGGWQAGQLIITAARLGVGKSWLLVKMATAAILTGKKVAFVTLEQPTSEIAFRVHTMLGRHFGHSLRHSSLMNGRNVDLVAYKGFLAELPSKVTGTLGIYDPSRGRVSPYTLATIIESLEPDVMFVDYITLMKKESDEWQGVAKLSQDTKEVALRYGVPIVCAAQINRLGEGGRRPPGVDKLSQGDSIGQDADVVVTGRKYGQSSRQWLLAKHRSGQDDVVFYSSFDPDNGNIEEITYEEAVKRTAQDAIEDDEFDRPL